MRGENRHSEVSQKKKCFSTALWVAIVCVKEPRTKDPSETTSGRFAGVAESVQEAHAVEEKRMQPTYQLKCRSGLANLAEEAIPRENQGDAVFCTARRRLRVCRSSRLRQLGHQQQSLTTFWTSFWA